MQITATKSEEISVTIDDKEIEQIIRRCKLPLHVFIDKIRNDYLDSITEHKGKTYEYNSRDPKQLGYFIRGDYFNTNNWWEGHRAATEQEASFLILLDEIEHLSLVNKLKE